MASLKNFRWLPLYNASTSDLIGEFYHPAYENSSVYRCVVWSLSPAELSLAARGLVSLIRNDHCTTQILVTSIDSNEASEVYTESSISTLDSFEKTSTEGLARISNPVHKAYMEIIAWLLNKGQLEIRICPDNGKRMLSGTGGWLSDGGNLSLGFTHAPDISADGTTSNTALKVRWSWGDPHFLVQKQITDFDKIWNDQRGTVSLPPRLRQLILEYLPEEKPTSEPTEPRITLFSHQEEAIENWAKRSFRGIFKMCTGAGKTIAALYGVRLLQEFLQSSEERLAVVVIVCPTRVLVEQWQHEIGRTGLPSPLLAYESAQNYDKNLGLCLDATRHSGLKIVVTTYATFKRDFFSNEISKAYQHGSFALMIADEMHNCAPQNIRLALKSSAPYFKYRLGLSATPEIEQDSTATRVLFDYFGGIVAEYGLRRAIEENVLCSYYYFPTPVFLDSETSKRYLTVLCSLHGGQGSIDINSYRQQREIVRKSGLQIRVLIAILDGFIEAQEEIKHTLVYCPPGRDEAEDEERLLAQAKACVEARDILCSSIVASTPSFARPQIITGFQDGAFQVLLSIGCLDEGLDIPSIKRAIMLYSIDRERQFVQRRGRILRRATGKRFAQIHDIIILPHNSILSSRDAEILLRKEMRRFKEFAGLAINSKQAEEIIEEAIRLASSKEELPCSNL